MIPGPSEALCRIEEEQLTGTPEKAYHYIDGPVNNQSRQALYLAY